MSRAERRTGSERNASHNQKFNNLCVIICKTKTKQNILSNLENIVFIELYILR